MNWADQNRDDIWRVQMIDPFDFSVVRGEFSHITGISLTWGYYTDTRGSADVKVLDEEYIPHSMLRIIHEIPAWEYSNEVFCGYVTGQDSDTLQGSTERTFSLSSVLYGLDQDLLASTFAIGKNGYAKDAMRRIASKCNNRPIVFEPGSNDYRFSSSKVYPVGDSYLETMFDLCDVSKNRLSVDGHGRITVSKYVEPSKLTPLWILDTEARDSVVLSESIPESTTEYDAPGRIIVTHQEGDNEIVASADADASLDSSPKKRGYMKAELRQETDLTGGYSQALKLAKQYLNDAQDSYKEWQVSSLYMPIREGDCIQLILDGTSHKTLAKSIDVDCLANTMKLTLKEI